MAFLRGDHQLNETKLAALAGGELRPMLPEEIEHTFGAAGYLGPIGLTAVLHPAGRWLCWTHLEGRHRESDRRSS